MNNFISCLIFSSNFVTLASVIAKLKLPIYTLNAKSGCNIAKAQKILELRDSGAFLICTIPNVIVSDLHINIETDIFMEYICKAFKV